MSSARLPPTRKKILIPSEIQQRVRAVLEDRFASSSAVYPLIVGLS